MAKIVEKNGKKCMAMNGKSGGSKQARLPVKDADECQWKENCLYSKETSTIYILISIYSNRRERDAKSSTHEKASFAPQPQKHAVIRAREEGKLHSHGKPCPTLSVGGYCENRERVFEASQGISLHNFLCMMDGDILTRFGHQDRFKPFSSMKLSGAPSSTLFVSCCLLSVDESLSMGIIPFGKNTPFR